MNKTKKPKISMKQIMKEIEYTRKTGKFRCMVCKKAFKKIDKYTFEPVCKHNGNIRMMML